MISIKKDNSYFESKLNIRRYMLRKYLPDQKKLVLDCCQGEGLIWTQLRQEFPIDNYLGLDIKPQRGRIKIDSVRYLQQYGWYQNIIDIDTYGSPWKHWTAMLPNIHYPIIVFMTYGMLKNKGCLDNISKKALGINFKNKLPISIGGKLCNFDIDYCLNLCYNYNIQIVDIIEDNIGKMIYMGLYLEPMGE